MPQELQDVYAVIAQLWCNPADIDQDDVQKHMGAAMTALGRMEPEGTALLSRFLKDPISEEAYVELFELNPQCALYLGSHVFEEPQTCGQAGVSDRNGFMIELLGMYRHFGFKPSTTELPDYLPLMVEFLALTAGSDDPIRNKLIKESMLPLLPALRGKLEELGTPYLHLLDLLDRVLKLDLEARTKASAFTEMSYG